MEIISEGISPNHNRIEIIFSEQAELLLESFKDPSFDCVKITSSTRYSGARAKHGEQTTLNDLPVNYAVDQKIRERFIYTLRDGIVFYNSVDNLNKDAIVYIGE